MKRIFHNPYSKGYNSLKVISDDIKVIAEVQKLMLNYYSGFEIIEQNPGYIVIKNISKTNN